MSSSDGNSGERTNELAIMIHFFESIFLLVHTYMLCESFRAQVYRLKNETDSAWSDIEKAINYGGCDTLTLGQVRNL